MRKFCDCREDTELEASVLLVCRKCDTASKKINFKKPMKVALITTVIGYSGSQLVTYAITDNRYPLEVEYKVIDACINSSRKPLSYEEFGLKEKSCVCAMEDTMNEISYLRYKLDNKGFLSAFSKNAKSCIE